MLMCVNPLESTFDVEVYAVCEQLNNIKVGLIKVFKPQHL